MKARITQPNLTVCFPFFTFTPVIYITLAINVSNPVPYTLQHKWKSYNKITQSIINSASLIFVFQCVGVMYTVPQNCYKWF